MLIMCHVAQIERDVFQPANYTNVQIQEAIGNFNNS